MCNIPAGPRFAMGRPVCDRISPLLQRSRAAVASLAIPIVLACGTEPAAVVAVAGGGVFLDGARLAFDDELGAPGSESVDSLYLEETTNFSTPAVENAGRLVAVPGIAAVVGHANSVASLAAAPIYQAHEVVQIAPTSTAPTYSEAGAFSFRMVPSDDRQGPFLVEAVVEAFPSGARIALVYVNDDYGRGLREAFLGSLPTGGYPLVLDLPFAEGEPRPGSAEAGADALLSVEPQVVVWLARQGLLGRFLPAIREGLPDVAVYGGDALSQHPTNLAPDSPWHGVRYVDFLDPTATEPLQTFGRRYRARFGVDPTTSAILTYEAVRLTLAGIGEGARTGPELRAWLASLGRDRPPWQGLTGPVSFDERGDLQRGYVMRTVGGEPSL